MERLFGPDASLAEGIEAGNMAGAARAEADRRLDEAVRSRRLIVDGAPDGYTYCVDHGTMPGIDPETGEWLRGGGSCKLCLEERAQGKGRWAGYPPSSVGPGHEVVRAPAAPAIGPGVDLRGAGPSPAQNDAQALGGKAWVVERRAAPALPGTPAPAAASGEGSADPWDDVFGFPARELRP